MLASRTSSKSTPSPERSSPSKRIRHSLPSLKFSTSCPHLPLLPSGKTSPAAVTSAVAFGSTTYTGPTTRRAAETKDNKSVRSLDWKRMGPESPWEERTMSDGMSPTMEIGETLAKITRSPTPPPLPHSKSDPVAGLRGGRAGAKSTLRLELPLPLLTDGFGNQPADQHRFLGSGVTCDRQGSSRFTSQPLLGTAYPTTPDIGLNNMTATGDLWDDERTRNTNESREAIGRGGATAAAQHVLLTAAPHLGRGGIAVLTPPDDSGIMVWSSRDMLAEGAYRKEEARGHGIELSQNNSLNEDERSKKVPSEADDDRAPQGSNDEKPASPDYENQPRPDIPKQRSDLGRESPSDEDWVGNAMNALMGSNLPVSMATEAVRILSYTLPCPLPSTPADFDTSRTTKLPASAASAPEVAAAAGQQLSPTIAAKCVSKAEEVSGEMVTESTHADKGITTALHSLTNTIQQHYSREGPGRVYIHVSHAINPQVPLNRLPSTPPSTGGISAGNTPLSETGSGGYFSPMVFNSIVVASNSNVSTPTGGAGTQLHPPQALPSPNPILPPSSLHLTLLERYIPPSSPAEDTSMFSPKSSILLDRLFELSPQGGSLLFVYPTRAGARSFEKNYLGPVLDPLLRKLMVLYALQEKLLWGIGKMESASKMADYPVLRQRVENFCHALSAGEGDLQRTPTRLIYAAKASVHLDELSWREWWTQQEQGRVRHLVKTHFAHQMQASGKTAQANPVSSTSSGYGAPGDLAREVLDGVRAPAVRPSSRGMGEAVLASSMSGTGSGGGGGSASVIGTGGAVGTFAAEKQSASQPSSKKRVEVGVFILRRGLNS